ncbi:hypothetical protein U1Q18_050717 [Sarracenia purpurea var. burkii]
MDMSKETSQCSVAAEGKKMLGYDSWMVRIYSIDEFGRPTCDNSVLEIFDTNEMSPL